MEPELIAAFLDWVVLSHVSQTEPPLPIGLNGNRLDLYFQDDFRTPIHREQMVEWAGNWLQVTNRNDADSERLADASMELVRQRQSWEIPTITAPTEQGRYLVVPRLSVQRRSEEAIWDNTNFHLQSVNAPNMGMLRIQDVIWWRRIDG